MLCRNIVSAQHYVKTWKISGTESVAVADSIPVDTAYLNYFNNDPINRFSIANADNGNMLSPIESKIYFDRPGNADFLFFTPYYPFVKDIRNATFYNTKTPYSFIEYRNAGTTHQKQENINFLFAANFNKRLNFGTNIDYLYAIGEYKNQQARRIAANLFGSYDGRRYNARGGVFFNNLNNIENGGIRDMTAITNPENAVKVEPQDIETNTLGRAGLSRAQVFYNHQYTIGFDREVRVNEDSVYMEHVPVTRFTHTVSYDDYRKRFDEPQLDTLFYQHSYHNKTQDTTAMQSITNIFSVSMAEEFNKWMRFGLTAYISNETQQYTYKNEVDTVLRHETISNTKIGGILSKQQGRIFRYNISGEINLTGYKLGDFLLKGTIGGYFNLWNDSISLEANGFMSADEPSYFLKRYYSNHFRWDNRFDKILRTHVGGTFSVPTRRLSLDVSVENITNYVYFNNDAMPVQHSGNIQVFAVNLKKDFRFGRFGIDNQAIYQASSSDALPLPAIALYHNIYYHDLWFKVLSIQAGVDVRYHSAYYAPKYMPATGQFYTQNEVKIGNYPVMNAYLNFHLKQVRFFAQYQHINNLFMKGAYFSMPYYPMNPGYIRLGLSWNFYN
jgi:hypothetical protein